MDRQRQSQLVCAEVRKLADVLHMHSSRGGDVAVGSSNSTSGLNTSSLSSVIVLDSLQRSCHSPIGTSTHDVLVLIATTLMHKLHTHFRTKKVPSVSELPRTGVAGLLSTLPLKAILLLLHKYDQLRRRRGASGSIRLDGYGPDADDSGSGTRGGRSRRTGPGVSMHETEAGTHNDADPFAEDTMVEMEDCDDLLTLVLAFPYGESLNASIVAEVSAQLLSLSSATSNATLYPTGCVSSAIPAVSLSVLVLVTQFSFSEVLLYSQPNVLTSNRVTTDVLPRNSRDVSSSVELLDQFMAVLLPTLPVILPPAVLRRIQDEFSGCKPCVYSSALLTVVSCLEQHFKPGNSALCMFKSTEFIKKSTLGKTPNAGPTRTEENCALLVLSYADRAYFVSGGHTKIPSTNANSNSNDSGDYAVPPLFGRYCFLKNHEDIVVWVMNSVLLRATLDYKWVACLKCLGLAFLSKSELTNKYSNVALILALQERKLRLQQLQLDDDYCDMAVDMVSKIEAVATQRLAAAKRAGSGKPSVSKTATSSIRSLLLGIRYILPSLVAIDVSHFCLHTDNAYIDDPDEKMTIAAGIEVQGQAKFTEFSALVQELREVEIVLGAVYDDVATVPVVPLSISGSGLGSATSISTSTSAAIVSTAKVTQFFVNATYACSDFFSWLNKMNTFMLGLERPPDLPGVVNLTMEVINFCQKKPLMSCMRHTWSSTFASSDMNANGDSGAISAAVIPGGKAASLLELLAGSADVTTLYHILFSEVSGGSIRVDELLSKLQERKDMWTWSGDQNGGSSSGGSAAAGQQARKRAKREPELTPEQQQKREREQLSCRLVTSLGELERSGVISIMGVRGQERVFINMRAGESYWLHACDARR